MPVCDDAVITSDKLVEIPQAETLVLHWDFENVTGSGNSSDGLSTTSDAKFIVQDKSSGSLLLTSSYSWFGPVRYHQYPGQGDFFLPFSTSSVSKEYVPSAKQLLPEVLNSSNLIEVRTENDEMFTRDTRPVNHFFSVEKSPYAIVSEEILKLFGTIVDFNNLIGDPVNRYRQEYKELNKLRSLYFQRVKNPSVDFEKFVDYFKWFDSALSQVLQQLIPASANFSDEIRTMIESHVLERNKYWNKFPHLKFRGNELIGGIKGINELLYDWNTGSAPVVKSQNNHGPWWKGRAERNILVSSGRADVDTSRMAILSASLSTFNRSLTTPLFISAQNTLTSSGGIKPIRITNIKNSRATASISSSVRNAHIPLGNYNRDYEIVQTSGRLQHNRFLVKSNGTASFRLNSPMSGAVPVYTLPDRSNATNKFIIAELFSSPGEIRTMTRGWLDPLAEEYSVYNSLNFRNMNIRNVLNVNAGLHAGQFGVHPTASTVGNFHKTNRNRSRRIDLSASSFVTASRFDNLFISKPIPQSELQYQWITASAMTSSSALGYTSNYSVPYRTSSVLSPVIVFVSASSIVGSLGSRVDFDGLNYLVYDPITGSDNILSSSNGVYRNTTFESINSVDTLNGLLLHRNGPYRYPSWKQLRLAQHPIVRFHKQNNILSVLNPPQEKSFLSPTGEGIVYKEKRGSSFTNYIEPPVSFKFRPIVHTFDVTGSNLPVSLRYSFGNNLSMFANPNVNNALQVTRCPGQLYDSLKNFYLDSDMTKEENPVQGFIQLSYQEVIFPKDLNTGLAKVRGRLNYAESAPVTSIQVFNFYDVFQAQVSESVAIADYNDNGIDRGPRSRRTFWKRKTRDRNRWAQVDFSTSSNGILSLGSGGSVRTTMLNSQGILDGETPSIWPFGMELFHTQSAEGVADANSSIMGVYPNYDFGELAPMRGLLGAGYTNFSEGGNAEFTILKDWTYWQSRSSAQYGTSSIAGGRYFYQNPTCSALYTKQVFPDHLVFGSTAHVISNNVLYTEYQDDFDHRFRVPAFAGKDPWYNSYEEYSQDIRYMGKEYSVIPEFNISKNMDFYVLQQGGNFQKPNDKFLTNPGASITQSSVDEKNGFDENFFATYAHSDFAKYLDSIVQDHDNLEIGINKLSLKCKGIKKLLPYNGFYPVSRTLQLATLFSQSYGPYIGGNLWANGKTLDATSPPSGNLALAAMLQPFFAPGILYNTIKAGIAMDFPVFTGSAAQSHGVGNSSVRIETPPNYRIQFESLVDIKNGSGMGGVPISASDGSKKIYWQGVEYLGQSVIDAGLRDVYFDWNGGETSPLYRLATQNFLAESINFFLKDNNLKTIASKPANKMKSMVSGNTYYLDVRLYRSDDILMYGGRWNNVNKLFHTATISGPGGNLVPEYAALSYTGKFFGHPFRWADDSLYPAGIAAFGNSVATHSHQRVVVYADPAYAPYLPPYYFKDSIARMIYTSDGTEKNQTDPVSYVLSKMRVNNLNNTLNNQMLFYNGNDQATSSIKPNWQARSTVSSSVNLFGVAKGFRSTYDPTNFDPLSGKASLRTVEDADATYNSWVISPKFECPILNFKNQRDERYTVTFEDSDVLGTPGAATSGNISFVPKGMWSGYGEFCTGSTGVFLSIEESYPDLDASSRLVTGSLIDIFGFNTTPARLGEIADFKEISEGVVAIPFVDSPVTEEAVANTVNIIGKNVFAIDKGLFQLQKSRKENNQVIVNKGEYGGNDDIQETTISSMIDNMKKFVLPPEMNFLKFNNIDPFIMYIFEFKHLLNKQDLADIWQGVMPRIAMTAEKDEVLLEHEMRPWEFFEGKKLPQNVRWMIFKVKKQAAVNYFDKTADSKDDNRFKFEFKTGLRAPDYSFNWPYDHFSLVELAQIETEIDLAPLPRDIIGLKPIPGADNIENVKKNAAASSTGIVQAGLSSKKELLKQISSEPVVKVNVFGKKK